MIYHLSFTYKPVYIFFQYRMHSEISKFPSFHFYENKLVDGTQMSSKSAPFHENILFGPYLFFDVIDGLECNGKKSGSVSLYNEAEAEAAVEILKFLRKGYSYNPVYMIIQRLVNCLLDHLYNDFLSVYLIFIGFLLRSLREE